MKCIVCKKDLPSIFPDGEYQPIGGVCLTGQAVYGSGLDGETVTIAVCDECLKSVLATVEVTP